MNYNLITNLQSCSDLIRDYVPVNLVLYSHIPSMVVAMLIGILVLAKNKTLLGKILFGITTFFSVWVIIDLISWLSTNSIYTMIAWSGFWIISALIAILSFHFLYVFLTGKDLNMGQKILVYLPLLPLILLTPTRLSIMYFDLINCEPKDTNFIDIYNYILGGVAILAIITLFSILWKKINFKFKKEAVLMTAGLSLFLFFFYTLGAIAVYLDNYSIEFYGLFGMVIFMAFLAYLIVKFKAFDIKLLGAQALVWALVILVGSQFLFVQVTINKILTAITLIISAFVGIMIVRSVKKEVALREQLEIANNNQQALIHFISHQIKGFFTKSKMIFSGLLEGDFGEVPGTVQEMAKLGLDSDNNAVAMVQDILGASNLKTGTTNYNFKLVDLTMIVNKVAENFKTEMEKKGLKFETEISNVPMPSMVDETQITQVFKNLMDNSLRYTPAGEIKVSLMPNPTDKKKALFVIKDTGVGLSDADKAKLFTEGGKGEESLKVNTNSTGYGLYIVKKIVDSHKGKIWAESAGRGHGSKFCVELKLVE